MIYLMLIIFLDKGSMRSEASLEGAWGSCTPQNLVFVGTTNISSANDDIFETVIL